MEPVFMILGQSAATAACLSLDEKCSVQDLPYVKLRERLLTDGQILEYVRPAPANGIKASTLKGLYLDDIKAKKTGAWGEGTNETFVELGYLHDLNQDKGEKSVRYELPITKPGEYEVRISYAPNRNRATNVPVTITYANGSKTVTINQRQRPPIDGLFISLGRYHFESTAIVEISNRNTDGFVIADAVELLP